MNSLRSSRFLKSFAALPPEVKEQANTAYRLWHRNPFHPSLHFKPVGNLWSARVGKNYRVLGVREGDIITWLWIGPITIMSSVFEFADSSIKTANRSDVKLYSIELDNVYF